ncbi:MAG: ABC transporter ATP-binding protein [Alphaproteobacteria bacterium]
MFIEVEKVSKRFSRQGARGQSEAVAALKAISLGVDAGRMLALVGPSGSGKTTLLRCIAGLETPDQGVIRISGQAVFDSARNHVTPTERRNVGLIFQSYALWPHMTVERNVAYPLNRRKVATAECKARVAKYLDLVGCGHLADRFPHELSGGQQQRIALARALVYEPAVVLFDEPLSNLDPSLREHLRAQIREIQRSVGFTGVYVTHDQGEAFYVGDQVAILGEGDLIQFGTPDDIYRRPASPGVARFVGATNRIAGRLSEDGRMFESSDIGRFALGTAGAGAGSPADRVVLMTRPESVRLALADGRMPEAVVIDRVLVGALAEYVVELKSGVRWRARIDAHADPFAAGQKVGLDLAPEGTLVFAGDDGHSTRIGSEEP